MGNICRSPAAEAVLKSICHQVELELIVESAGTEDYHVGETPDQRMLAAASARGLQMTSVGRQVTADDLQPGAYDRVIAMDRANRRRLDAIASGDTENVVLFSDYLDKPWPDEVPDPYYGGDDGFEFVLDMLQAGCPRILASLNGSAS